MKTNLSTRQLEVLRVILVHRRDRKIDLDTIMAHVEDRTPFIHRSDKNNNNGHYRDQRRNGVIQALRMMGYKLNLRGAKFGRVSALGRGNKAVYAFVDNASVVRARAILKEDSNDL